MVRRKRGRYWEMWRHWVGRRAANEWAVRRLRTCYGVVLTTGGRRRGAIDRFVSTGALINCDRWRLLWAATGDKVQ